MTTPQAVIVVHGGSWRNNRYEGGTKDYIPIPPGGISFVDMLSRVEVRLNKDMNIFSFDLAAIVKVEVDEDMRMKVMDQYEWTRLMDLMVVPTIYVNTTCKCVFGIDHAAVGPLNIRYEAHRGCNRVSSQWIVSGASQQASLPNGEMPIIAEPVPLTELGVGCVFQSKDNMVSSVHAYHLKNFLEFRTKVLDKVYYHLEYKFQLRCVFCLRSRSFGSTWRVYEFTAHTCEKDIRIDAEPKVFSRAVAEFVGPKMNENGIVVRPRDIQGQLLRELGVRLKYPTALRGLNRALKAIYGDHDKSFQMIASYLYMLEYMNPGSDVDLQTSDDFAFEYCYFSLATSIRAFRACRPVIVIDATYLKGKYKGILFVASTKDANEQIVPMAFCIGDKENVSSWTWFLKHVRTSFGTPPNLLIVSDQHRSIKNSVEIVYPGTPHGFCTYHIQGNLRPWAEGIIDTFHAAANAYKEDDLEKHMRNLEKSAPGKYAKLLDIGPVKWARCKCPVRRYEFGTSNAVEVINSRLKWGRKLPVTSLLEYCRNLVQSWFYQRRSQAGKRANELSEYAEGRLGKAIKKGSFMTVEPISDSKFNIISGLKSYIVDLEKRECSCQGFQLLLLPCSHSVAAMRYKKQTPVAYVHTYYLTSTWREIYASDVMPMPDPSDWHIPSEIECRVVGTPKNPKQAGRPRVKRIPSIGLTELVPTNGMPGVVNGTSLEAGGSNMSSGKRRRKPKKCGICHVQGHTHRTCKDPRRFD